MGKIRKLSEEKAEKMLKRYGIQIARHVLAKNPDQAVKAARDLGYPVVMKVASDDVLHKTETGGVQVDLRNDKEVIGAYGMIMRSVARKAPDAKINGVLLQHMHPGREIIIGAKRDPQFGPVIMFGLGGVFVEVMKDVSFRLIPLELPEVREMIREIKGYPVLEGVRGKKPVNFRALEKCILSVSRLMERNSEIQELDLNPIMINAKQAIAVDVRVLNS
jgi:acetyl-CoA synthetase (ADP-forming)